MVGSFVRFARDCHRVCNHKTLDQSDRPRFHPQLIFQKLRKYCYRLSPRGVAIDQIRIEHGRVDYCDGQSNV